MNELTPTLVLDREMNYPFHKGGKTFTFRPGDTVLIETVQGAGKRNFQSYEGTIIKMKHKETFTIQKEAFGFVVELTFPFNSSSIVSMTLTKKGAHIKRSKLYFMRQKRTPNHQSW
jgi:ribosomal protein L19